MLSRIVRISQILALTLVSTLAGCTWTGLPDLGESTDPAAHGPKKPVEADDSGEARAPKLLEEQELKLAKLWSRVDEMEEEQYRQKERLVVIEKGLTLGLVPEELKHPEKVKAAKKAHKGEAKAGKKTEKGEKAEPAVGEMGEAEAPDGALAEGSDEKAAKKAAENDPSGLSKEEKEAYQSALANAHDSYRAGRYGRAIVEYSAIGKKFGDQVGAGMHLYWIAKCWVNLKEYNTAKQQLSDFLKKHGDSPWAPRAKFELGRVQWQLGMQETALATFRGIIQDHPYEDAAEMAKMELENLDKKL